MIDEMAIERQQSDLNHREQTEKILDDHKVCRILLANCNDDCS